MIKNKIYSFAKIVSKSLLTLAGTTGVILYCKDQLETDLNNNNSSPYQQIVTAPQQKSQEFSLSHINGKHFDVAVLGGGSGGIAFCYEAHKLGLNVVLLDFVEPTNQGTKWGLGGTCVNVGCIPKKLMHTSALHKEYILNSRYYGWNLDQYNNVFIDNDEELHQAFQKNFSWQALVNSVQEYIKTLNIGFKNELQEINIPYINALGAFEDHNTIIFTDNKQDLIQYIQGNVNNQNIGKLTADRIVIAVGGRPYIPDDKITKNAYKYAISSDDIFSLKKQPGKTLIVGSGYIGMECAGFLNSLGFPISVMSRSKPLRVHDQDCATKVIEYMESVMKIKFLKADLPYAIEKNPQGNNYIVKWNDFNTNLETEEIYDTILFAIGRIANTNLLNLDKIGVKINPNTKKIIGGYSNEFEQTSIQNIYAIGDVLNNCPELTPVAIKSGRFLAHRIKLQKENNTIFTPIEYSYVGFSEELAQKIYGEQNIEVYHSVVTPLEEQIIERIDNNLNFLRKKAYIKVIVNKLEKEKIVGMHYVGPNAGEIIQGYSVALKLGATKFDLDRTIGIHPTISEEFTQLETTKRSGKNPEKTSC